MSQRTVVFLGATLSSHAALAATTGVTASEATARTYAWKFTILPPPIPTLGEWAVIGGLLLLGALAVRRLVRAPNGSVALLCGLALLAGGGALAGLHGSALTVAGHDPAAWVAGATMRTPLAPEEGSTPVSIVAQVQPEGGKTLAGVSLHYRETGGAWSAPVPAVPAPAGCATCWTASLPLGGFQGGDTLEYYLEVAVAGEPVTYLYDGDADPASCLGKPDFTACEVVTAPLDLAGDICVADTCVSAGTCGSAACNAPGPAWPVPDAGGSVCQDNSQILASCPGIAGSPVCATTSWCGQDAQVLRDPAPRYARLAGDHPVVTDLVTGLEWQGCLLGQTADACTGGGWSSLDWYQARQACEDLVWAGRTDWRLPDRFELQSLVDYGRPNPAIDPTAFPNTFGGWTWTSSVQADDPGQAWFVYFWAGKVEFRPKGDSVNCVARCVRRLP